MSGKDSKSIIQRAKLDLDSIVKLAQDNILKEHEDRIHKMIEEAMDEVDLEDSKVDTISEMIKLETDDMKIVVDDDGSTKVEHKEPEAGEEVAETPVDAVTQEPVAAQATTVVDATPEPAAVDAVGDEEEIELSSDEDEIQIAAEAEQTMQPMNQEQTPAAPEAAPVAPAPVAPEVAPEMAPEAGAEAPAEDLAGELASVIGKMIAQQTGGSVEGSADGDDVNIVDDESEIGAVAPGAAPEAAPAPAMEEMIELDEDDDLLEIEFEEEEEVVMDEVKAMGVSHALNRTAGPHTAPEVAVKNRTRSGAKMNENTEKENAQYEAIIAELKNENKGLKGQIGEFRSAFIELREHYDEMQTFNQKLVLAHRVITQGGWTEKEKARISERFEAAKDADEAKRIYKEIMSERSVPKSNDVIKSSAIPVVQSKKQPIYESESVKRARILAGIDTPNED